MGQALCARPCRSGTAVGDFRTHGGRDIRPFLTRALPCPHVRCSVLFSLLGYQVSPRLADMAGSKPWRIDRKTDHGPFKRVMMKPRAGGNQRLHRFLNIADGIASAHGKKIIFSTNLPNIHDIDEALVRPGRRSAVKGAARRGRCSASPRLTSINQPQSALEITPVYNVTVVTVLGVMAAGCDVVGEGSRIPPIKIEV